MSSNVDNDEVEIIQVQPPTQRQQQIPQYPNNNRSQIANGMMNLPPTVAAATAQFQASGPRPYQYNFQQLPPSTAMQQMQMGMFSRQTIGHGQLLTESERKAEAYKALQSLQTQREANSNLPYSAIQAQMRTSNTAASSATYQHQQSIPSFTGNKFTLSLLSSKEFTVTHEWNYQTVSTSNLRPILKKLSKDKSVKGRARWEGDGGVHGRATGRWRIPLSFYQNVAGYLMSQPNSNVIGIASNMLKAAAVKDAEERSPVTTEELVKEGIPRHLAQTLKPYQQAGVKFLLRRNGRALLADDMGLGKTIQSIAAMSAYADEWPLLILTPSTARYHWESELLSWLHPRNVIEVPSLKKVSKNNEKPIKKKTQRKATLSDSESEDDNDADVTAGTKKGNKKVIEIGNDSGKDDSDFLVDSDDENDEDDETDYVEFNVKKRLGASQVYSNNRFSSTSSSKYPFTINSREVFVYTSGSDKAPKKAKAVVASISLAPTLVENGEINNKKYKCVIVDESHMLKNMKSKRTKSLMPFLRATERCLMLSGTPAFARPLELYPQLNILDKTGEFWGDYDSFVQQYCKRGKTSLGGNNLSELYAVLTSTLMIRRVKANVLKQLPPKRREKAYVKIDNPDLRNKIADYMDILRDGNGVLAKIAKSSDSGVTVLKSDGGVMPLDDAISKVEEEVHAMSQEAMLKIRDVLMRMGNIGVEAIESQKKALFLAEQEKMKKHRTDRMKEVESGFLDGIRVTKLESKNVLTELFKLTGQAKIPIILAKVRAWIKDPLKGKLCIFAHHLEMLDTIESKALRKKNQYIRIDGSTSPKHRQEYIDAFQKDPKIRVALLGITAAGVAVTLTASSTVWFTELFWTPAMLVQAEDRVHRIGQTNDVNILYLVAKGSLDELLWKLCEKKFETLGEMVEGKGKTLRVHEDGRVLGEESDDMKDHKHVDEDADEIELLEGVSDDENDDEGANLEALLSPGVTREIQALGREEREHARQLFGGEAEGYHDASDDDNMFEPEKSQIIELSDDEDEDEEKTSSKENEHPNKKLKSDASTSAKRKIKVIPIDESSSEDENIEPLKTSTGKKTESEDESDGVMEVSSSQPKQQSCTNAQFDIPFKSPNEVGSEDNYRVKFTPPSFGITLVEYRGKAVVGRISEDRAKEFGMNCLPHIGDIVTHIGNRELSQVPFRDLVNIMKDDMTNTSSHVILTFNRSERINRLFHNYLKKKGQRGDKNKK